MQQAFFSMHSPFFTKKKKHANIVSHSYKPKFTGLLYQPWMTYVKKGSPTPADSINKLYHQHFRDAVLQNRTLQDNNISKWLWLLEQRLLLILSTWVEAWRCGSKKIIWACLGPWFGLDKIQESRWGSRRESLETLEMSGVMRDWDYRSELDQIITLWWDSWISFPPEMLRLKGN